MGALRSFLEIVLVAFLIPQHISFRNNIALVFILVPKRISFGSNLKMRSGLDLRFNIVSISFGLNIA